MLESLAVIAAAMIGGLIWIMLPEHWQGLSIIAFIVFTIAAVLYRIVLWLM